MILKKLIRLSCFKVENNYHDEDIPYSLYFSHCHCKPEMGNFRVCIAVKCLSVYLFNDWVKHIIRGRDRLGHQRTRTTLHNTLAEV